MIDEEQGLVYFKNVRAVDSRGTITAGDDLVNPQSGTVTPSGYASNSIAGEQLGAVGNGTLVTFSGTAAAKPVRPESLRITVESDAVNYAVDDGKGNLLGIGVKVGTVNYATGAISITWAAAPANAKKILMSYHQNLEAAADIPEIESYFDSKTVKARAYALNPFGCAA